MTFNIAAKSDTFPQTGSYSVRARLVMPMMTSDVANGVINVSNGVVDSISKHAEHATVFEFDDAILVPGFVNAHVHLEASNLNEPVSYDGTLPNWIKELMAFRQSDAYNPMQAYSKGSIELWDTGTTAVGDIMLPQQFLHDKISMADALRQTMQYFQPAMAARLFYEMIGWEPQSAALRINDVRQFLNAFLSCNAAFRNRFVVGISPHAPYTICPELLYESVSLSQTHKIPLAMHLAETEAELELLATHSGSFVEMMRRFDTFDPKRSLIGIKPLDYLTVLSEAEHAIIIHGNYLDDQEIRFLAKHRENMSVIFCPVPHRFFGHKPYPLRQMLDMGVRVALGTDSRASWPSKQTRNDMPQKKALQTNVLPVETLQYKPLSMLETINQLQQDYANISSQEILEMATLNGATALQLPLHGQLTPGLPPRFALLREVALRNS